MTKNKKIKAIVYFVEAPLFALVLALIISFITVGITNAVKDNGGLNRISKLETSYEMDGYVVRDACDQIYSANIYIKTASDWLYDVMGIQLYYIGMYVPEDCNTREDWLKLADNYINDNIKNDNAIYVLYSFYEEGDNRDDFFVCNELKLGDNVKTLMTDEMTSYYESSYAKAKAATDTGEVWYTIPDCVAIALYDTFSTAFYYGEKPLVLPITLLCSWAACYAFFVIVFKQTIDKRKKRAK